MLVKLRQLFAVGRGNRLYQGDTRGVNADRAHERSQMQLTRRHGGLALLVSSIMVPAASRATLARNSLHLI